MSTDRSTLRVCLDLNLVRTLGLQREKGERSDVEGMGGPLVMTEDSDMDKPDVDYVRKESLDGD